MVSGIFKQMTVVCVVALLFGCGRDIVKTNTKIVYRAGSGDANGSDAQGQGNEGDGSGLSLKDLQSAYGIRTFNQVIETMAVVTGVDPSANNIQTVYNEVKAQLPPSNDIKTFLASNQVGISKLAVEFCDNMISNQGLRGQKVPGFNFGVGPNAAFNGNGRTQLVSGLTTSFWGSGLNGLPDQDEVSATMNGLIDDLNAGSPNNATTTQNTAKGVCTAVLSAAPAMIF